MSYFRQHGKHQEIVCSWNQFDGNRFNKELLQWRSVQTKFSPTLERNRRNDAEEILIECDCVIKNAHHIEFEGQARRGQFLRVHARDAMRIIIDD